MPSLMQLKKYKTTCEKNLKTLVEKVSDKIEVMEDSGSVVPEVIRRFESPTLMTLPTYPINLDADTPDIYDLFEIIDLDAFNAGIIKLIQVQHPQTLEPIVAEDLIIFTVDKREYYIEQLTGFLKDSLYAKPEVVLPEKVIEPIKDIKQPIEKKLQPNPSPNPAPYPVAPLQLFAQPAPALVEKIQEKPHPKVQPKPAESVHQMLADFKNKDRRISDFDIDQCNRIIRNTNPVKVECERFAEELFAILSEKARQLLKDADASDDYLYKHNLEMSALGKIRNDLSIVQPAVNFSFLSRSTRTSATDQIDKLQNTCYQEMYAIRDAAKAEKRAADAVSQIWGRPY